MSITTPEKILVPTDLSEASRSGLRVAGDLARRFGSHLTVLHVEVATAGLAEVLATAGEPTGSSDAPARHLERARAGVERFVAETIGEKHEAAVAVVEGLFVAETIVRYAADEGMDWICVSAAGHQGWRHLLTGSVTAEVVRRAPLPVLTIRGRTEGEGEFVFDDFRRVLVAVDLGEDSASLVEVAAKLAEHGKLTLLHVIEIPPEYGLYGVPLTIPAENLDAAKEWTEGALERLAAKVDGAILAPFKVLAGRPTTRILQVEQELAPDVTVVGTHGRHGLDRLMPGSVAERIVRRATGPVLMVPASGPA